MTVITRFAPSPTGMLHIGSARTALFNWLYSRHHNGKYQLRIEDTDKERSTKEAISEILEGLEWMGIKADGDPVYQSKNINRHIEISQQLLAEEKAYKCYCSPEELEEMRNESMKKGKPIRYDGKWRDRDPSDAPSGINPTIRFKAPNEGLTNIKDLIQGDVTVANKELDDMIILRADGTPTYMLSAVVDDHDMGITHVIRGDDHLTNTFRQIQIYKACGWEIPEFAHMSLILSPKGGKLSKRDGALAISEYRKMGYLPNALNNYLLRIGWSHGNQEIISNEEAIKWFDIADVGKAAAKFDMDKLDNVNAHYIRSCKDTELILMVSRYLKENFNISVEKKEKKMLINGMSSLKQRAKSIVELAENSLFFFKRPINIDGKALKTVNKESNNRISDIIKEIEKIKEWKANKIEDIVRKFSEKEKIKLGDIAQPIRIALTGSTTSPPIFEVMEILEKKETLLRLQDFIKRY